MAQYYEVTAVDVWKDEEGEPIQDEHGNTRLSVGFMGEAEAFDMVAKKLPMVGEKEYGHTEEYTTRKGNKRQKFKRDQLPDSGFGSAPRASQSSSVDRKEQSRDITLGLVYKTFVQAEGMLPQQAAHWDKIVSNWQTLLDISAGRYELPKTSGYNKARATAENIRMTPLPLTSSQDEEPPPGDEEMPLDWLKDEQR